MTFNWILMIYITITKIFPKKIIMNKWLTSKFKFLNLLGFKDFRFTWAFNTTMELYYKDLTLLTGAKLIIGGVSISQSGIHVTFNNFKIKMAGLVWWCGMNIATKRIFSPYQQLRLARISSYPFPSETYIVARILIKKILI